MMLGGFVIFICDDGEIRVKYPRRFHKKKNIYLRRWMFFRESKKMDIIQHYSAIYLFFIFFN